MTIKLEQSEGNLPQEELYFFIKGNLSLEKSRRARPLKWIPEQGWEDIMKLMEIHEVFQTLPDDLEKNEKIWKEVRKGTIKHLCVVVKTLYYVNRSCVSW